MSASDAPSEPKARSAAGHDSMRSPNWGKAWPFLLLAFAAAWLVYHGTRWGPWTFSDGVGYLVSARNLLTGPGLGLVKPSGEFEPLISHPPLYPLLIAALGKLGMDLVQAARWINVLASSLLVGAAGWLTARLTKSPLAGAIASVVLLVTTDVLLFQMSAMADPLFLATGFVGLLLIADSLSGARPGPLLIGSALIGLSLLTRYPAVVFWATATVGLLTLAHGPMWNRWKRLALSSGLALGPTGIFLIVSATWRQAGIARAFSPSAEPLEALVTFARRVSGVYWRWKPIPPAEVVHQFLPVGTGFWLPLLLSLFFFSSLGALLLQVSLRWQSIRWPNDAEQPAPTLALLLLLQFLYLGFFALTYLFTFPIPDVDERTLLPLLVGAELTMILLVHLLIRSTDSAWPPAVGLSLLAVSLLGYGLLSTDTVRGLHRTGSGYTSRAWRTSQVLATVRALPPELPLLSNAPEAILLHTNRYPHQFIPLDVPDSSPQQMAAQRDLLEEGAALVLIDENLAAPRPPQPSCDLEIDGGLDLVEFASDPTGAICFDSEAVPLGVP